MLAPDLPGHGRAAGPFTLDRAVESVRAVVADAGGRAHLVGISGGATVALLTYLEDRGCVASLVLFAGVAHAPRLVLLQRAVQRALPEPVLARLLRGWYSGGRREYEQLAAEDFRRCGKRIFLAALGELAHIDLRGRLGEVAVPTRRTWFAASLRLLPQSAPEQERVELLLARAGVLTATGAFSARATRRCSRRSRPSRTSRPRSAFNSLPRAPGWSTCSAATSRPKPTS